VNRRFCRGIGDTGRCGRERSGGRPLFPYARSTAGRLFTTAAFRRCAGRVPTGRVPTGPAGTGHLDLPMFRTLHNGRPDRRQFTGEGTVRCRAGEHLVGRLAGPPVIGRKSVGHRSDRPVPFRIADRRHPRGRRRWRRLTVPTFGRPGTTCRPDRSGPLRSRRDGPVGQHLPGSLPRGRRLRPPGRRRALLIRGFATRAGHDRRHPFAGRPGREVVVPGGRLRDVENGRRHLVARFEPRRWTRLQHRQPPESAPGEHAEEPGHRPTIAR